MGSSAGAEDEEDLRVEVVNVDYYMAKPLPPQAIDKLPTSPCYLLAKQVPVVRIFGATPAGQKALVHVHGIFPYFYFRAEGDPVFDDPTALHQLLPRIAHDIERQSMLTNDQKASANAVNGMKDTRAKAFNAPRKIAKMLVVQGVPFYGFHASSRLFVQVFVYNPLTISLVVKLLESGQIAERVFQPYEAHIPYLLQVFADYNIEGMNHVHLCRVKFRAPLASHFPPVNSSESRQSHRVWLQTTTPPNKISGPFAEQSTEDCSNGTNDDTDGIDISRSIELKESPDSSSTVAWYARQSTCALEVDVAGSCILNPSRFAALQRSNQGSSKIRSVPSLAAIWEEERHRRLQRGDSSVLELSSSIDRNDDKEEFLTARSNSSFVDSQSFFLRKMHKMLQKVIDKAAKEVDSTVDQTHEESFSEDIRSIDASQLTNGVAPASQCAIDNASGFSYSADKRRDDELEDQEIINVLLAMQQRAEKVADHDKSTADQGHEDRNDHEVEEEEEDDDDKQREDDDQEEIQDILASQSVLEHEMNHNRDQATTTPNKWWEVVPANDHRRELFDEDIGSPRVRVRRRVLEPMEELRPHVQQEEEEEDSCPVGENMEDFLPPAPSAAPLANVVRARTHSVEEESTQLDVFAPTPNVFDSFTQTELPHNKVWRFKPHPPSLEELESSSHTMGIMPIECKQVAYTRARDIPEKALVFAGQKFRFVAQDTKNLLPFDTSKARKCLKSPPSECKEAIEEPICKTHEVSTDQPRRYEKISRLRTTAQLPPDSTQVAKWLERQESLSSSSSLGHRPDHMSKHQKVSSASAPTISNHTPSNLTLLALEVFAPNRGRLLPDPVQDAVVAIAFALEAQEGESSKLRRRGILLSRPEDAAPLPVTNDRDVQIQVVVDEFQLFRALEALVHKWNPDFLVGFEVQKASLGYLIDRAAQLDIYLIQSLSRLPLTPIDRRNPIEIQHDDESELPIGTKWGMNKASGIWIHGRYVLNLWRMARSELKLQCYLFEDVVRHVLKRELPVYSVEQLTDWYRSTPHNQWRTLRYVLQRATLDLKVLSKMQLITRTSEMARLFGIDFFSVLSRGSQYRVEAVMVRVTKRNNFVLVSPNRTQVASQAPMECIPLVMEPHSAFYADPVVVLDFQSLYPSLMIAYNLCFSTILGRLQNGINDELEQELGVVHYVPDASSIVGCGADIVLAPNGLLVCPKTRRLGVIPTILSEILATRIMVKKAMKDAKKLVQMRLHKVLDARQLALKMIANVTYGYTAAGFSGRMPCAQLADAIVQSGRCTLEAAVRLVEGNEKWNARIVYGDTDSLFVLLKGRNIAQAFQVGQEIADAVTASNPKPITLKLEKVYDGCVLVSKKRYVGFKYEHPDQTQGVIDAKGLEVIRRDSCGVVRTSMKSCLELLFKTRDLSLVKRFMEDYWLKMLEDKLPLDDFIFAKEVRLGTYSSDSVPPAALVSMKEMSRDPRKEPRYAERVRYVVINGVPGARLMDLVVAPEEVSAPNCSRLINYQYYITKQILPSLERLFLLMGVNVRSWYAQLPRSQTRARDHQFYLGAKHPLKQAGSRAIDSYYMSKHCRLCGTLGVQTLCESCSKNRQRSGFAVLQQKLAQERELALLQRVCSACGHDDVSSICCVNFSCRVWNARKLLKSAEQPEVEQLFNGSID